MQPIVVEGHKGAGKTPLINSIENILKQNKYNYEIVNLWHLAINKFQKDPYFLFSDPKEAREIVSFLNSEFIKSKKKINDKLIIYDRQWLTFLTSLSLIDQEKSGFTLQQFQNLFDFWVSINSFTVFLSAPLEILRNRNGRKGPPPWNEEKDWKLRLDLKEQFNKLIHFEFEVTKPRIDMDNLAQKIIEKYHEPR